MGNPTENILNLIAQKPPFLFVDEVLEKIGNSIKTQYYFTGEEDFFTGHFPENPIVPGVLLQEAIFQSGAALMSKKSVDKKLAFVTRVENVKFREVVRPKDLFLMEVILKENISNAYYMKGAGKVNGKTVIVVDFVCTEVA